MKIIALDFQYFEDCPNHVILSNNLLEAIQGFEDKIELKRIIVESEEVAQQIHFRGSPTVLINGTDIENVPAPIHASLSCRYYRNGIPSVEMIHGIILEQISQEGF
jgi:hypothetical protein